MDFNLKKYRILKTKKELKYSNILLIFNAAKVKEKDWITIEKKIKQLKLSYTQIFNKTTLKTIYSSVYKNINELICSVVLFIKPNYKTMDLNLLKIRKELKKEFLFLFLKLNNKIYSFSQLKLLNTFSYKKNVLIFNNSLENSLKLTYKYTTKNRNNVI